jgi:hypothetical protein
MGGNAQGFNPYASVNDNPETKNDPSGHWGWGTVLAVVAVVAAPVVMAAAGAAAEVAADGAVAGAVAEGAVDAAAAGGEAAAAAGGEAAATAGGEAVSAGGEAAADASAEASADATAETATDASSEAGDEGGNGCDDLSFRASTPVATAQGQQAIGMLKAGEKVWSYNSQTKRMELEPIQKIWLNHDNDLVVSL